jgi:hypothetical protein
VYFLSSGGSDLYEPLKGHISNQIYIYGLDRSGTKTRGIRDVSLAPPPPSQRDFGQPSPKSDLVSAASRIRHEFRDHGRSRVLSVDGCVAITYYPVLPRCFPVGPAEHAWRPGVTCVHVRLFCDRSLSHALQRRCVRFLSASPPRRYGGDNHACSDGTADVVKARSERYVRRRCRR